MATVIDALVVTLGLDPTEFKKGQRDAAEAFKKTRDEADKTTKTMQSMEKSVGESFEGMTRRALTFFAVLAGAKTVEEFTSKIISQDAALGRLAITLGVLPQDLSAMSGAIERNGGTAEAATASFKSLSDQFEELKINGNASILPMLQKLQGMTGKTIDITHGFAAALPGIAEALKMLKDAGRDVDADFMGRSILGDPETAIALEQGWAKFSADVARYKKDNPPDERWVKMAQEISESFVDAKKSVYGFLRYFPEYFGPLLVNYLHYVRDLFSGTWTAVGDDFKAMVGNLVHYLDDFGNSINQLYHRVTGKWIFDPTEAHGARGGETGPGGGMTGLRSRRGEFSGNDAIRRRGSGGLGAAARNENAKAWIDEMRKAGYNENAIAATVGSTQTESSFNPFAHNNVGGGHTGAWQWDSTRWPKIAAWISSHNGNPYDYRWQAKAWIAEHNAKPGDAIYDTPSTQAGGTILRNDPSLDRAIHGVRLSERFSAGEEGGRAANAARWLPQINREHASAIYQSIAGAAAAYHRTTNDNSSTVANTSTVNVGHVSVHTQATDGEGIAKSIKPALTRHAYAIQANRGPN